MNPATDSNLAQGVCIISPQEKALKKSIDTPLAF